MITHLNYDFVKRFHFIELIVFWENRLTTKHIQQHFNISRSSASKHIQDYLKLYPDFLVYNNSKKGYQATKHFIPKYGAQDLGTYLHITQQGIQSEYYNHFTAMQSPLVPVNPKRVSGILHALKHKQRIDVGYASVSSPEFESRIISPHNLVFDGTRWHVRAYCEKNRDFRDFVLTRFNGECEIEGPAEYDQQHDTLWQTQLTVGIEPDPRLTANRARIIALDHQMNQQSNGNYKRNIKVRAALLLYLLKQLRVDSYQANPEAQQIILSPDCLSGLQPYMP
ncbi:WYL domain-containing protein [Pseudoalteromonas sp. SWXJZ94C]|uniref:WYL domain-containing protein n=1 Tax=Pseudoalteromonas sp. SWXJZ94C TaxID=2792065 RepID=UPI0018CFC243|nr:WYL domain-containing protein [Pseudoalteromonas sp. SWXJZ94C]